MVEERQRRAIAMRPDIRYHEPFAWWGSGVVAPEPRTLRQLLSDGTIDAAAAALLWAILARGGSLVVIGGPSGLGKSTLLSALCDFLPRGTRRVYLRGCYETFAFLNDEGVGADRTALIVNEISPHLPVYLWGPAARRALELRAQGYAILATAHAESPVDLVGKLTGSPLRLPTHLIAGLEHVVLLERSERAPSGRLVTGVWRLAATRRGLVIEALAGLAARRGASPHDISPELDADLPGHFSLSDLAARAQLLRALGDGLRPDLPTFGAVEMPEHCRAAPDDTLPHPGTP